MTSRTSSANPNREERLLARQQGLQVQVTSGGVSNPTKGATGGMLAEMKARRPIRRQQEEGDGVGEGAGETRRAAMGGLLAQLKSKLPPLAE